MNKYVEKIDFSALLDLLLSEKDYADLVTINDIQKNLLDNPIYRQNDEILRKNFERAIANGVSGELWEQDKTENTFRHIALNRKMQETNKFRLYLCPKEEYLYQIVNEILKRCSQSKEPVYLKYSREDRYDRIVIFVENKDDLLAKVKLLEQIKNNYPDMFMDMKKSDVWLSESPFKGAYMCPEKITKRDYNADYPTYTKAFQALMFNVENEMQFYFKTNNFDALKKIPREQLIRVFKYYFLRELGKMGLFIYFDEYSKLQAYTNSLFPGFGKSVDESIILTNTGLEIGKRIDSNHKVYYRIPFGESIPITPEEYKRFDSYVMDDETFFKKRFYPDLFQTEDPGRK